MENYSKTFLTFRRIFFWVIAVLCLGICALSIIGNVRIELWQTILLLVGGLFALEWAG